LIYGFLLRVTLNFIHGHLDFTYVVRENIDKLLSKKESKQRRLLIHPTLT